jgi:uncharacterized protein YacL (UPF0231 family)
MDYDFSLDEYDKPIAEFSSGFEALGRWINEEVGSDQQRIDELLDVIEQLHQKRIQKRHFDSHDAQLTLTNNEVEVRAFAITREYQSALPDNTQLYDQESHANCGLVDFKAALIAWQEFVTDTND